MRVSTLIISSCFKMFWSMRKWTYFRSYWEFSTKCWLPWSIPASCSMITCLNCWPALKKIFSLFFISMSSMKDYKMPNTSLEEDRKCSSGKFSFGGGNLPGKRAACTLSNKSRNFSKSKSTQTLSKRKNPPRDSKSTKPSSLLTCTWTSTTTMRRTSLLRTSHWCALKSHLKLLKRKGWKAGRWILAVQLAGPQ